MKRKYFFFDIDGTLGLKLTMKMPADTSYTIKLLKIEPLPLEKSKSVLHALENSGIP